jgi:hypothetical protein
VFKPYAVQTLRFTGVLSATGANKPLRDTVSIFEVTRLFERTFAALTTFQLAFPGKDGYRTAVSAKICGLIRS